jgi:fluoride exporter
MSPLEMAAVAAGGAVGAMGRHLVNVIVGHLFGTGFPYNTMVVNVVGSFAMGVLVEAGALVWSTGLHTRLFLATGLLGAFTTFSTFSLDFAVLFERRAYTLSVLYALLSLLLSLGALFAGLYLIRRMFAPSF